MALWHAMSSCWLQHSLLTCCAAIPPLPAPPHVSVAGKLGIIKDAALRARWEHASSRAQLDELAQEFIEGVRSDT